MSDNMKMMKKMMKMDMFRKTKRRNHKIAAMMIGGMGILAAMTTTAAFMVKKKKKMQHDQPMEHCDCASTSENNSYEI